MSLIALILINSSQNASNGKYPWHTRSRYTRATASRTRKSRKLYKIGKHSERLSLWCSGQGNDTRPEWYKLPIGQQAYTT
jgi:hypothetical protein